MKTVHVVFESPQARSSGAALRNRALGSSLSRLGPSSLIAVQDHFAGGNGRPERKASRIEARIPAEVIKSVLHAVAAQAPDAVIIDGIYLGDVAHALVEAGHRVILDMHNIESALQQEIDLARRGWIARLFYRNRWKQGRDAEGALAKRVAGVWLCSAQDADILRRIAPDHAPIAVVPNPVPEWCQAADPAPAAQSGANAIFVGHLGYRPNDRAARRLIRQIQPILRARLPDFSLTICGRSPGRRLRAMGAGQAGVELVADPPDLAPFYSRAAMTLIPLTEGGGTRLKVLEALALGVPVIATAKAVEGIAVVDQETFLAAETDEDFARAAERLARDDALRAALARRGYDFVAAHHMAPAIDQAVAAGLGQPG
ncbi:glycosyltransferase family 4 protein [Halodurantibacterium flavum]|uniref:Glycosyltransferase family 4 protein n=1 Tax=Halodurantibacterium flavum TaxID=1382802 RepID=A0ABW4S4W8_9RHOB